MKRILLTRRLHEFALKELRKKYKISMHLGDNPIPRKKLLKEIINVDGLICMPYDIIDKEVIDAGEKLSIISTYSVGYDHIDVKYATSKKIKIGYTPDILTFATADLTFTLILDLLRRVTEGDRIIRKGKWHEMFAADDYLGVDIANKTLGIFGLGRIGKQVAKRASAFNMNVIYHNRHKISTREQKSLNVKFVTLNELLKKSDILSIHAPYTKLTDKIIDINKLEKMKKTAYIVNTARGKIIKESDLVLALKRKIIAGAALDVFQTEPITKTHSLAKMQNVVLSPHIGSATQETRIKMAKVAIENLKLGLEGKEPIYVVKHQS